MTMGDTMEQDATLAALRDREAELRQLCMSAELELRVAQARHWEISDAIAIVQRGGKRKPGPKSGARPTVEDTREIAAPPAESAGEAAA